MVPLDQMVAERVAVALLGPLCGHHCLGLCIANSIGPSLPFQAEPWVLILSPTSMPV